MDKKRNWITIGLCLVIGILLIFNYGKSVEIVASGENIEGNYTFGEVIQGEFNLTLKEIDPVSYLTTSLGHRISLQDFLENGGESLVCLNPKCEESYINTSETLGSTALSLGLGKTGIVGIKLEGEGALFVKEINLGLSSSFGIKDRIPLSISLFDSSYIWNYIEPAGGFNGETNYSCYDPSRSQDNLEILNNGNRFCGKISGVGPVKKILAGVNYTKTGGDNPSIRMSVYRDGEYNSQISSCTFVADGALNSCTLDFEEGIEGELILCVEKISGESTINVKRQTSLADEGCGGASPSSINPSDKRNYALYMTFPRYASVNGDFEVKIEEFEGGSIEEISKKYIQENYDSDCSRGCFLPIKFTGTEQNLNLKSIGFIVNEDGGDLSETGFYNISKISAKGDFDGTVDMENAGFEVLFEGNKTVRFYINDSLGGVELFSKRIESRADPLEIRELIPSEAPAGVPVMFSVNVKSTSNVSSYEWNFGDGDVRETSKSNVIKTYSNISSYNLTITVTNIEGDIEEKNFTIKTISPKDYLNSSIILKEKEIEYITNETNNLGALGTTILNKLRDSLNLTNIQTELNKIKSEKNSVTTDEQFLDLAKRLGRIDIPKRVWIKEDRTEIFMTESEDINLGLIGSILGKTLSNDGYKKYISNWEIQNVRGGKRMININYINGLNEEDELLRAYKINITPLNESAYLIIDSPEAVTASVVLGNSGDRKYLKIERGNALSLDMIVSSNFDGPIYVAVDPSNVNLVGEVGVCNFNGICETGETYKNCRDDCKPWPRIIIIGIISILLFIILYGIIQFIMIEQYESGLFKRRQDLENVIEAIKSSRESGKPEEETINNLIKRGWSKEQVRYAIKRSKKQRARPYEIIPLESVRNMFKKNEKVDTKTK